MNPDEFLNMLWSAFTQHVPATHDWVPLAGMGATILFGLILLLRGAKLAPLLAAVAFLGFGGIGGSFLASWTGFPAWPTIVATGVVGFIIGLALFRFWLAILLAACFSAGALSIYYVRVLNPQVANYTASNFDAQNQLVTLPGADGVGGLAAQPAERLADLWAYLGQSVVNFRASFIAIALSAGLAGLIFGLLLPKVSRALWAASGGIVFLLAGLLLLLDGVAPAAVAWLCGLGAWGWGVVGLIWAASLVYNLLLCREKRPKKPPVEDADAEPAPA
jgi:hypothetical protein